MFLREHRQRKAIIKSLAKGQAAAESEYRLSDVTFYSEALYAATAGRPARYREIATRALVAARKSS